ncbi:hypothetical protein ONE63_005937 [Megalurothrips usitatus]|uniref:Lipase domain-containing protein n=1 Tax=Megalurothrips usitatus TaxID=439358 RepID=A0AAV7XY53_9NEOP|nr:hypothetical protein ONE63_005937 [Megalurothrips usitatus]
MAPQLLAPSAPSRLVTGRPGGSNATLAIGRAQDELLAHPAFDVRKNLTVLFVPGFTVKPDNEAVAANMKAFLSRHSSVNCVQLDWSDYSGHPYIRAVYNLGQVTPAAAPAPSGPPCTSAVAAAQVASEVSRWLEALVRAGLRPDRVWLVGQSLGAHLGGKAAAEAAAAVRSKLARITGLDPAGPLFWSAKPLPRLSRDNAGFVDVIHSDAGWKGLGLRATVGHLDFWPNYGARHQPGCHDVRCSHSRALEYFTESVLSPAAFPAVRCDTPADFRRGRCAPAAGVDVVPMGFAAAPSVPEGSFLLRTGHARPYALGEAGLWPAKVDGDDDVREDGASTPPPRWDWEAEYTSD